MATPNSPFVFNKEKYLKILKSEGAEAALTQLHHDVNRWEIESFEGRAGYQPKMWNELHHVREFSRELWEIANVGQENKS